MPDKFVLQHDTWGTIHQFLTSRQTYCGKGKSTHLNYANYTRKKLSKAMAHPRARHCQLECKYHQN